MADATELRQRKPQPGAEDEVEVPVFTKVDGRDSEEKMSVEDVMDMAEGAPPFLQPYIEKLAPAIAAGGTLIDAVGPYAEQAFAKGEVLWIALQPYHPEEFLPVLMGLFMVFFGAHFAVTIAAVEAFRLCGWDRTRASLLSLWDDYLHVRQAYLHDDTIDADNDGVADVDELSHKELATRKLRLIMRTADMDKIMEGASGVANGAMGVLATLRTQYAMAMTLGSAVGASVQKACVRFVGPSIRAAVAPEYRKWVRPGIEYGAQGLGVLVAYMLQSVFAAAHSAFRGAHIATRGAIHYASRHGYGSIAHIGEGSPVYTGITVALAVLGFYWQTGSWFGLGFPWNVLLFPLSVLEWVLAWVVYSDAGITLA